MFCKFNSRLLRIATVAQLVILASTLASEASARNSKQIDKICNNIKAQRLALTPAQREALASLCGGGQVAGHAKGVHKQEIATRVNPDASARLPQKASASAQPSGNPQPKTSSIADLLSANKDMTFAIGKDFTDIGILKFGVPNTKVTGATVSYADDRSAKDSSWTFQGVGTIGYQFLPLTVGPTAPRFTYGEIGIYGGVDKFSNTNVAPVTKSKDTVLDGGFLEFGYDQSSDFSNYFRIKAGSVTDNLAQKTLYKIGKTTITTTESATQFAGSAEWFPNYDLGFVSFYRNLTLPSFGGIRPVVQLDPELKLHYDNTFNSTKPLIFSNKSSAARIGPQIAVSLTPLRGIGWADLDKLTVQTTYYWWHELEAGHSSYAFKTSLNYPLSSDLGLSVGYQRGADESTGKNIGLFTIGLTGQLCANCNMQGTKNAQAASGQ